MDALEFFRQRKRMCKSFDSLTCEYCELNGLCELSDTTGCDEETYEKIIKTVAQWAAEHPERTREDEFLTMFPNAHMKNGHIDICPKAVDTSLKCPPYDRLRNVQERCKICNEEFWLAPLED